MAVAVTLTQFPKLMGVTVGDPVSFRGYITILDDGGAVVVYTCGDRWILRWPPGPRQTVKTQLAVRWKSLDRQILS
jgi:hypothetical protein